MNYSSHLAGWGFYPTCPASATDDQIQLFQLLGQLKIPCITREYLPKFIRTFVCGKYPKNIVLKDRKGVFYYLIIPEDEEINLKKLKILLNAHRNFSFASQSELSEIYLGKKGSVSPFGLVSKPKHCVKVFMDQSLTKPENYLHFHPLTSDISLLVGFKMLVKFLEFCDVKLNIIDVPFTSGC